MKLWDKGFDTARLVEEFTVGSDREYDLRLAKYDVLGSMAHAKMLCKINILSEKELRLVLAGLRNILEEIETGDFIIEDSFEDVHSKIEYELVQLAGEVGKKIHTARSRNDQVLVDIQLFMKDQILEIMQRIGGLSAMLLGKAEKYKDALMPGYTHQQIAMPSSFGLWFSAFAETLADDLILLNAAFDICDQNPLGSAAGYGSSFPVDREMTTELLGFSTMKYNVVAAQMNRGRLEKTVGFAISSVAGTLARLASDVCLYSGGNFNFFRLPRELTTGSSIMPHKQNPDVFELIRAKCNQVSNFPAEVALLTSNLPSGYHRDYQLLKEGLMENLDRIKDCLHLTGFMLERIEVNEEIRENSRYDHLYSVEAVNRLVLKGASFRDAYREIGRQIQEGAFVPDKELDHSHAGSMGNLCLDQIREKLASQMAKRSLEFFQVKNF